MIDSHYFSKTFTLFWPKLLSQQRY